MEKASDNQEFERAIELRDRITNLERAGKKQKVSNFLHKSIDVIGIAGNNLETHLTIFEVRGSNLDNKKTIILKDTEDIYELYDICIAIYHCLNYLKLQNLSVNTIANFLCRGVLYTPLYHTQRKRAIIRRFLIYPFIPCGMFVGRMQYAPTTVRAFDR